MTNLTTEWIIFLMKVVSAFFGCPPLQPVGSNVTCTNRIQKLTKGVQCAIKVPLGTVATFTCHENFTLIDPTYNSVKCKFPGKWDKTPPTCVTTSPGQTAPVTTTTTAATTSTTETTSTTATTSTIATTTTTATTTTKPGTTTEPLLLPIATKRYEDVGLLSAYNVSLTTDGARQQCARMSTTLLFVNSVKAREAAVDILDNVAHITWYNIGILVDPFKKPDGQFYGSDNVMLDPQFWCPDGRPNDPVNECTIFAHNEAANRVNCYVEFLCGQSRQFICRAP